MDEKNTGAIRMVAFGVLQHVRDPKPLDDLFDPMVRKDQEVEALVCAEFNALGWKLSPMINTWGGVAKNKYILHGVVSRTPGLVVRPTIGKGTLQECCQCAITYIETGRTEKRYNGEEEN